MRRIIEVYQEKVTRIEANVYILDIDFFFVSVTIYRNKQCYYRSLSHFDLIMTYLINVVETK